MIIDDGNDRFALLVFVPRVPNPITTFLATVLVPSPWSTRRSRCFSAVRCRTLAINDRHSDPSLAHVAKTLETVGFFDVVPGYGHGKAEEVLGRALHGRQEPVVITTKVRLTAEEMHDVAGAVRTSVEASLRRLRREMVDVLHVHNRFTPRRGNLPHSLSADDALGPVLDAYRQMQHTGKTRFIGQISHGTGYAYRTAHHDQRPL
jgi:predicted aldo/keto reductase-like oxidoreductase